MTDFFKRHTLIASTLLLTATGFATRLLGFFYRIFLSRTIGAEGLGIFNMVHPVYGICFALCAGSIQTAISRFVAADVQKGKQVFRTGLVISLTLSIALSAFIIRFSEPLARFVLMERRCASLLPFIAVSVPFSAVHACINGYYYGIKKAKIPAASQIAEQMARMAAVFLIADILLESGRAVTVELAATGHLVGELAACLFSVLCFCLFTPESSQKQPGFLASLQQTAMPLMALAMPLMGNRLVLNILSSAEAIWIPNRLSAYGLSSQEAISVYGVLTGMAMPAGVK